jgi:hypothetical protein
VVANIFTFLSLLVFRRLVAIDYSKDVASWSVAYILFFPTAFFLSIGYSEALFLFLVLSTFLLAKKNIWWGVGLVGLLASMARPLGVLVFIPILIGYFEFQKIRITKVRWTILFLLLMPLGLGIYQFYLWHSFSNPFAFIVAEAGWHRSVGSSVIVPILKHDVIIVFSRSIFSIEWFKALLNDFYYILPIVAILYLLGKKKYSYASYILLLGLAPLLTGAGSFERYVLILFPIYIVLADLTEKHSWLKYYLVPFFIGLLFIYVSLFVNGFWVA